MEGMEGMDGIRELQERDLPAVGRLLAHLAQGPGEVPPAAALERLYAEMASHPAIYVNLVAVEGGEVIGFLSLLLYRTLRHAGGTALINELVVETERRGLGTGRRLLKRAVTIARERGMDEIEVGAERTNGRAIDFYRRNGFDQDYVLLGRCFHG